MRSVILIAVMLLTGACWTPGPGQIDPTRYPWEQRKPAASYCIMSLETPSATGIAAGQNVMTMKCKEPDAH